MDSIEGPMIDETDMRILTELERDARQTPRQIGAKIDVSHATVRRRIKRLYDQQAIEIALVTNPRVLGYHIWVMFGIKIRHGQTHNVATELVKLDEFYFITECLGVYEVMASAHFKSFGKMVKFIDEEMGNIDGIERVDPIIRIRPLRYFGFTKF
ncbi:Lrp/AsnC family transcriptional regulator [Chloroflexota bacterium]